MNGSRSQDFWLQGPGVSKVGVGLLVGWADPGAAG